MDPRQPFNDLPPLPPAVELETRDLLKACIEAHKALASLRQATGHLPNPAVLIKATLILEAQASSEFENIVTTTDELFRYADHIGGPIRPSRKPCATAVRSTRPSSRSANGRCAPPLRKSSARGSSTCRCRLRGAAARPGPQPW